MIRSVGEFLRLRESTSSDDQARSSTDAADDAVWLAVIEQRPDLRKWVAHNKTVPLSILRLLLDDPDAETRSWVARKRKLYRAMFVALAQDPDERVRFALCANSKVPPDLLRGLESDSSAFVANAASERLAKKAR